MDLEFVSPFVKSTKTMLKEMSNIDLSEIKKSYVQTDDIACYGITSLINFVGKNIRGRFIIDIDFNLAFKIAENVTSDNYSDIKDKMLLAIISELNNTIAGDANTYINNKYNKSLRLAPPIVFSGRDTLISLSQVESLTTEFDSTYGRIKVNIAFEEEVK